MEEREENERLKQKMRELEEEWTAVKTGKSSSAVSWITMEKALEIWENTPRNLMLSLQHEPKAGMMHTKSPLRRKLFDDSDDDDQNNMTSSSCWSSDVMRGNVNNKKEKRGRIVSVTMVVVLLLCVLVVLMNGFNLLSMNTQINTLVPT